MRSNSLGGMMVKNRMRSALRALLAACCLLPLNALEAAKHKKNNPPWYPSIDAFEHYNSGCSHLFTEARFGGSFKKCNKIIAREAPTPYPSVYNMTYLDSQQIFAYGGGYGNNSGSIGAFIAKINPATLQPIWYNQLIDTSDNGEWDYPGVMGILRDGCLYVIYGYRLSKLDLLPGITSGSMVQPDYFGNMFYGGKLGAFYFLRPIAKMAIK